MEKLTNFWKSIVGEDADPKKLRKVYIVVAVIAVILVLSVL